MKGYVVLVLMMGMAWAGTFYPASLEEDVEISPYILPEEVEGVPRPGQATVTSLAGTPIDSAGNQFTMLANTVRSISWSPAQGGVVCIVNRGYTTTGDYPGLDSLNYHVSKDGGRRWHTERGIAFGPAKGGPRFPTVHASGEGPYLFWPQLILPPAWDRACGMYRDDYLTGNWRAPETLWTGRRNLHKFEGVLTEEEQILVVGTQAEPSQIPYAIYTPDLDQELHSGHILEGLEPYNSGWDYNAGVGALLTLIPGEAGYTSTTDGGYTWGPLVPWRTALFTPVIPGVEWVILFGLNTQINLTDEGNPLFGLALFNRKAVDRPGADPPEVWPGQGFVYLSFAPGDTAIVLDQENPRPWEEDPPMMKVNHCYSPQVATGTIKGCPVIVVTWLQTDGTTTGLLTKWDIYARVSTTGGETWGPILNLTKTPDVSEGYMMMARRVDHIQGLAHIIYAEAMPDASLCPEYSTATGRIFPIRIKYINIDIPDPVQSISLTFPTAGATLHPDSTYTIRWTSKDPEELIKYVSILLSTDGGKTYADTVVDSTENTGSYEWRVPSGISSDDCRLRIRAHGPHKLVVTLDESDKFAIRPPPAIADRPATELKFGVSLAQPNPFSGATEIRYTLPKASAASLRIYDITGKLVRTLVEGEGMEPGEYSVRWDGRGDDGRFVPSGVYFVRLETSGGSHNQKLLLVR